MSKILITKNNLDKFLEKDTKKFLIDNRFILSPGVKDILDERGVKIIYKSSMNQADDKEKIIERIYKLLKEDFNIQDEEKIEKITRKVLKKNNK